MILRKLKRVEQNLQQVESYEEWLQWAVRHDEETGKDEWREKEYSKLYDYKEIKLRLNKLRSFREKNDDRGLLFTLNEGIHGNMGGMGNAALYAIALSGTKKLVEDYIHEIDDALWHLADFENEKISIEEKKDFFSRASICFGRSALMLSGGGSLGNFHLGVLKTLSQQQLLPAVISGSSAGSIFAGLAGTRKDEDLVDFLTDENIYTFLNKEIEMYEDLFRSGKTLQVEDLEAIVNNLIPDVTFQEAFQMTGRKINISVAPNGAKQKSRLLNSIASPNVLLRSAIMASCAIPGVFPPVSLFAKNKDGEKQAYLPSRQWVDGSMSNDLPSKRLSRLYGVNHFIVSLVNPLVLPFIKDPTDRSPLLDPIRRIGISVAKETAQFNYSITEKLFPYLPKSAAFVANAVNSVIQQDYTGDINIIANLKPSDITKLRKSFTAKELKAFIQRGEKATYPKIEAIRLTTKIGRTLDRIITAYDFKYPRESR